MNIPNTMGGTGHKMPPKPWSKLRLKGKKGSASVSRFSCVQLFATSWTVAHQAPLSMGVFRQEYWSGLPCLPPGDLPHPGIKPAPLLSPVLARGFFTMKLKTFSFITSAEILTPSQFSFQGLEWTYLLRAHHSLHYMSHGGPAR